MTTSPNSSVRSLSREYERLHVAKEDAYWSSYMGLTDDADAARADLDKKEIALKRFLQDPERLEHVRAVLRTAEEQGATGDVLTALRGWERTLGAHAIDSAQGRALAEEIIGLEGKLEGARGKMRLGYQVEGEEFVEANSVRLAVMLQSEPDEAKRRAAWLGLVAIEDFVLEHGFVEVVRRRNRLGRLLGGEDYYDWKVKRNEGMSKHEIFSVLDELEEKTRDASGRCLAQLREDKGDAAVEPWNLLFHSTGDITAEQDPYFPFSRSFERWGRSFAALGIDYNGAEMVLDLVDRKGKYENGFMHGPVPPWRDGGEYHPARIQFTANAIPGMVGSGKRATETLFHEGGHAAHFANIDMPAPCFSQEFAPTSVSFAELQSMFLDSLVTDPDWRLRYARTTDGEPMPRELIEKSIRAEQPFAAQQLRRMLSVPYAERAIYEIPDDELTAERVKQTILEVERRLCGMDRSPRPVLSVPHLLSGEASAYYHGYLLALVAVAQTRAFFLKRDGHLVDNPRIGPALRDVYWKPGNSKGFFEFVQDLTGEPPSATPLADRVNLSADDAIAEARERIGKLDRIPKHEGPVELGARIRVAHGNETVASSTGGDFDQAADAFAAWIDAAAAG